MPSLGVRKRIKVAISYGQNGLAFGVTAGGNYGKGYGNGDEQSFRGSRIGDKHSQTTIHSQADTNIKGSQVSGEKVNLKAQNLNIESLQDTMTYKGKQQNMQAQVTIGYGFSASGSFNRSKVNADYASVTTQAGIFAGGEGYNIEVDKHTDLKGAIITSTEQAETDGKNSLATDTLSYSHIENRTSHSASGIGVSGSVAMNFNPPLGDKGIAQSNKQAVNDDGQKLYVNAQGEQTTNAEGQDGKQNSPVLAHGLDSLTGNVSMGFGSDKQNQHSQTKSGINTANIHIRDEAKQLSQTGKTVAETLAGVKTETTAENAQENSGKLENNFDKNKVQAEVDYQIKVITEFQTITKPSIDSFVASQAENKRQEADNLEQQGKHQQAEKLRAEAKNWEIGGKYRQAVEAITNAVGLALGGKPTEGVIAGAASPYINEYIKRVTNDIPEFNIPAHMLWGAIEAELTGGKAASGAIAAGIGEAGARYLTRALYSTDTPEQLTEAQKQNILELSKITAGVAAGLTAAGGNSHSIVSNVQTGMDITESAVGNNAVNKSQAGTVEGFESFFNTTRTKMGTKMGKDAEDALFRLDDLDTYLKPATTGPFNTTKDRYIYTEKGGWIDMAHFLFYAGAAYSKKISLTKEQKIEKEKYSRLGYTYPIDNTILTYSENEISQLAVNSAVKKGYWQERFDSLYPPARHSAYSYEDLPSDRFGAEFGAYYFNPKLTQTLGEQVSNYLRILGATKPQVAPNYNDLPTKDLGVHSGIINKTTKPLFTKEEK